MKMIAFWDAAPCSLEVDRHFRGAYYLNHQDDGGSSTSETSVYFDESTWLLFSKQYVPWQHEEHVHNDKLAEPGPWRSCAKLPSE
jgi:hypothetical protein